MFLMRILIFCSTFIVAMVTATDLWETTNLFSDATSSTVSFDGLDSSDPLSSAENSGSNTFIDNDETGSTVFAENDCAIPLVSSPIGRTRRRSDLCSAPSSQLQLPTLDDIPLAGGIGSALDSLKNEEVCSPLVFGARNIPICSSGNLLDQEFIWADYGYSLKHCTLFITEYNGCFFALYNKDIYCCSEFHTKGGIGYAKFCSEMFGSRLQGKYESLP